MRTVRFGARGLLGLAFGALVATLPCGAAPATSGTVEDTGVEMRWGYQPASGASGGLGRLTLDLRDRASGTPLRYPAGQIAAWLQRQRPSLSEGELSCKDRVKSLVSTGIGRRADVDLNTYRILTLNADQTLAVINPFVTLNNAKLESIVPLPGMPLAWAHMPAQGLLWVLLDGAPARVVGIDTHLRSVVRTHELVGAAEPNASLAVDEHGQRLWVALPAAGRVALLDLPSRAATWRFAAAPGLLAVHRVDTPQGTAVLSTHADGRLVRWRSTAATDHPEREREWALPHAARGLAYSALGQRLVAHDGQAVLVVDLGGSEVRRLTLGHPVGDLALADEGRYAIAAGGDRMSMVDLASGKVQARSATVPDARQVVLTSRFAYAIGADESAATLWALADLRAGRVQPAQVILGTARSRDGDTQRLRRAVVAPGGAGLLVAHRADQLVYQYSEGMMAPIGSYSNYRRTPLAVGLLDLAPREVAPGRYQVPVRYDVGGVHHLVVSGAGPRFVACDRVTLAPTLDQVRRDTAPAVHARLVGDSVLPGARRRIVVALSEQTARGAAQPLAQVPDLTLLLFDKRSGWQQRARLREQADAAGRYVAEVGVPPGARYELFVGSASRDLPYVQGRLMAADALGARP